MKRILITILLTLQSFLVSTSLAPAAQVSTPAVESPQNQSFIGYAPNKIVVKFEPSIVHKMNGGTLAQGRTGIATLDDVGTRHGVASIRRQFPGAKRKNYKGRVIDLAGWHKVTFHGEVDVLDVVEKYKKIPGVIDAQPVSIHRVYREPMEQFYDLQWHLPRIKAPEAWDIETGNSNIVVAILDTGVRYFQKDLGGVDASYFNPTAADGNMWINWIEKNGADGLDDDGNGYEDDWIGWDFVEDTDYGFLYPCYQGEDCGVSDNDPRDFNGHGTHCAGSVAAMNNNNEAVASVAGGWGNGGLVSTGNGVKVMSLRIGWSIDLYGLDYEVGVVEMDYAAEAFYYAAENGARIASCSWGSENTGGLGAAIDYFLASGGLIFKAAGNEDSSTPDYMGSRDDIISVAATDESDCKASFSNYGNWVDIAAPGVYIWSLFHDHTDPATDYVAPLDGTSMAAPLAASVAALTWSQEPSLSAEEVKQMLYLSADPIDGLSCNSMYTGELGAGRINAYQAVYHLPTADFGADPTCGYNPLTVNFTDESTGIVTDWSWDFDNDGIEDSADQNPTYTYSVPGTYTVKLAVSGLYGSDNEVKVDFITVNMTGADLNMEVGEVSDLTHNWKQVGFSRCFVDPVVVAKPLSYNGSDPALVRLRNVDGRGFEIRVQEWDYLDGQHTLAETVSYMVMERGSHILDDGTQVEAGSFMTNLTSSFGTFSFNQSFQVVPVLMAAVASFNEGDAVTDRLRNITTEGFDFRMQEQGANVQRHGVETINYIAWEPGLGTANGLSFEVGTTGNVVTDQFYPISFSSTFQQAPRFLADMQTTNGEDTAAMRWQNRDPYEIEVKIEEDQSFDQETDHITEVVGYMAFSLTGPGAPPVADFSATYICGAEPLRVDFTDLSKGSIDSWSWDFDNDGIEDSADQNPTYTYSAPGTYTVKLTVSGLYGSDNEVKVDFITVNMTGADLNMEVGEVSDLTHNWKQVGFSRCFVDPVVVAKPLSYNGSDPALVRLRNVDGRGFEIRVQEWDYLDGQHTLAETVSYMVMERGSHILDDGTQVEAGSFMTNLTSSFGTFSFNQSFQVVPVLMAAVASFNEGDAVTDRLRNITTEGFDFRMQEQGANVQRHGVETINYIAWEPGLGTANGLSFEVGTTGKAVTDQFYPISFSSTFQEAPRFLADMQTTNGEDTAAMRWQNRTPQGAEVKIEEDQSFDQETNHITEVVGYMAFSTSSVQ